MTQLENQHIICISSIDWDPIWTRKQQVMSRLPESNTILYVEPPVTLLSPFKDRKTFAKWLTWLKGIRRIKQNIFLYTPPPILPFGNKFRLINKINQWWTSIFIKRIISALKLTNPIVWSYMPNSIDLIDLLGKRSFTVYDCVDEHSEYTGFINKELVIEMERQLMKKCDIVFVTAKGLYESKKAFAKTIFFLPNAADVHHFMKAQDPSTKIPSDIVSIPKPIIGFIGVIQDWIDLELIRDCALFYPDYSFVMVGPLGAGIDVSDLKSLPNVHFLGRKNVSELPGYLKHFDVCINPFKINNLTDKVSPLKFYEYLASGKPIVSVKMPGINEFSDIVEVCENSNEFIQGIKKSLEKESPTKLKARLQRALENSWESRVLFMESKILERIKT